MKSSPTVVETGSGHGVDLAQPSASQITVVDIVHTLAMCPHFLGAVNTHYSIAQHLLSVFELVQALQVKEADRACLFYFISHSHIPYLGDIPKQALHLYSLQKVLADVIRKLHNIVRKHIEDHHNLSGSLLVNPGMDGAWALVKVTKVLRAYEGFHLLQGGGWTMSVESSEVVDLSKLLWDRLRYRFEFDKPPPFMHSRDAHAKLLARVNDLLSSLRKSAVA